MLFKRKNTQTERIGVKYNKISVIETEPTTIEYSTICKNFGHFAVPLMHNAKDTQKVSNNGYESQGLFQTGQSAIVNMVILVKTTIKKIVVNVSIFFCAPGSRCSVILAGLLYIGIWDHKQLIKCFDVAALSATLEEPTETC